MSSERNKWIDAVGKLITLTQERKLAWRTNHPQGSLADKGVDVVYEADYKGKTLRLYETRPKTQRGMFSDMGEIEAALELVDSTGLSVWTFPYTEVNEHLLGAVKYQVAGVGEFLEELLTA